MKRMLCLDMGAWCGLGLLLAMQFPAWAQDAAALPRTCTLADAAGIAGENWGARATEDGCAFRPALKGKDAVCKIPNWWGGGIRPPKGSVYVLEINYKDTVSSPVVVESFANVGSYTGLSELHRFGGENDSKWKIAQVPVSWDLIMLREGQTTAEFAIHADADLPVSQIVVRNAKLPEDQVRYEVETRAWIAKAQEAKAVAAKCDGKDETPVIPAAIQGKGVVAYVRPYYEAINPNSAPQAKEAGRTILVRLARNEFEPGAFGVYAQEDVSGVTYEVSDLTGPSGKLACDVWRMMAEYALVNGKDGLVWRPQRFWPVYPARIQKGRSLWCFFTIHTQGETSKPGIYEGKVTVTAGSQRTELPIKVEVLPFQLLTMEEAGLRMGGCCTGLPSAGELKSMSEHNHNMVNLWFAGARPEMKKVGDKLELDFYYLDDWMKMARENGVKTIVWFLGGNPNGYPETMTIERELYKAMIGPQPDYYKIVCSPEGRGKTPAELVPIYKKWLRDVVAHARANNWPELIFTPFDEPAKWASPDPKIENNRKYAIGCGPWIRDHFKYACALIHEAVPGTRVYASIHHNNVRGTHGYNGRVGEVFLPDVDVFCTNAIDEDENLGNKVRKAGKAFWQYGGGGSTRYGFGFYFGAYDSRGSLCWAYNWGRRFDTSEGANWEYAWYSPFGTIVTPDYEMYREAWDDRRYIETARSVAKAKGSDIAPLLAQIAKETLADRGKGGRDKVNDFWEEGRTATKMDYWRKLLADKIMELDKK
jgi:hypothetical protein